MSTQVGFYVPPGTSESVLKCQNRAVSCIRSFSTYGMSSLGFCTGGGFGHNFHILRIFISTRILLCSRRILRLRMYSQVFKDTLSPHLPPRFLPPPHINLEAAQLLRNYRPRFTSIRQQSTGFRTLLSSPKISFTRLCFHCCCLHSKFLGWLSGRLAGLEYYT
jgi:hypothetical protein